MCISRVMMKSEKAYESKDKGNEMIRTEWSGGVTSRSHFEASPKGIREVKWSWGDQNGTSRQTVRQAL
jgi:hypothetical protein